jgi:predicted nucleic acid-binding protein
METWVVDASVAVKWFVLEASSDRALDLATSEHHLIAPDIVRFEIAAALSRRVRDGVLDQDQANQDLLTLSEYFSDLIPSNVLLPAGFERSVALRHHLYDCIYLAAARARGAKLVTADAKFAAKVSGTPDAEIVVLLADWKP